MIRAGSAFAGNQPSLVKGDGIGARHVVVQHPGLAIGGADTDPALRDFGGIEVALRIED